MLVDNLTANALLLTFLGGSAAYNISSFHGCEARMSRGILAIWRYVSLDLARRTLSSNNFKILFETGDIYQLLSSCYGSW